MKIERLFIYCLLAGTSFFASCSSEDMTDNPVETLPEGMYPLTFTATQGEVVATPQTRVTDYDESGTHKSKWDGGEQIKVQIGNGTVGTYILKADGTINEQAANTPAYWQSNADGQDITAWYSASATPNLKDQSDALPYVLKVTAKANFNAKPTLPFAHKLAKFRFKLTGTAVQGVTPTVRVNGIAKTKYENGEIEATSTTAEEITPHQAGDYYEVLLLPGQVVDNFIKITVPAIGTYYYTPKSTSTSTDNLTLAEASCYTYDITVDVPGPTEIDLSQATGDITIDKAREYILSGSTTYGVTISADATVTLKNASIILPDNSSGAPIQISGNHTATLILDGSNTLTSITFGYPAILPDAGSTVKINGTGSLTATGGSRAAGIGAGKNLNAGIVKILGGTITSNGDVNATGIGGCFYGSCQGIEILGGTVTARAGGGFDAPAIGSHSSGACEYVTLQNCTINAYPETSYDTDPAIAANNVSPNVNDKAALEAAGVKLNVY